MLNKSSRAVLIFLLVIIAYFFFVNPTVKISVKEALAKINDLSTYRCRIEESARLEREDKGIDTAFISETTVIKEPYQSVTTQYVSENEGPLTRISTKYEEASGGSIAYHVLAEPTGIWFNGTRGEREEPWYLQNMVILTEKEIGEEKTSGATVKVFDIVVDGGMFARMYMTEEEQAGASLNAFKQIFGEVRGKAYIKKSNGQLILIFLDLTPNVHAMEKCIRDGKWLREIDMEEIHAKLEATIEILDMNEKVQIAIPRQAL